MSDRYTKGVLTVIAAALVGLLVQSAIGPSNAQNKGVSKVQICDAFETCAGFKLVGGRSVLEVVDVR